MIDIRVVLIGSGHIGSMLSSSREASSYLYVLRLYEHCAQQFAVVSSYLY